jgi:hydroxypyruvate isomerase
MFYQFKRIIMQNRRTALKNIVTGTAAIGVGSILPGLVSCAGPHASTKIKPAVPTVLKGNINQSVCPGCYSGTSLDDLCQFAKKIGIKGMDLMGPEQWPTLKKYGLDSSMCNGAEINLTNGFNDTKYHEQLIKNYTDMIPKVAAAGYKNLICFSGNKRGMDDETGWQNCVDGLSKLLPLAEKHGVVLVMELLNSKVNHKDYQCDRTSWGAELCKRLGSAHFKLLYDIYHMQVNEGDVIHTINTYHQFIAHYHTAGVPGRNEIDDTQELYYPAIMRAIAATGFKGYVGQEFVPKNPDKLAALQKAVQICDI